MKKIMLLFVLAFPMSSQADYVDVIAGKLNPGCTMATYLQIVQDFRGQWANANGYKVEILFPVQSRDLSTFYWVGRMASAEAFGKAADSWTAAQADANSVPAKLMARFRECNTSESRAGYFTR
ncbi:MAG: hypothetical protein H6R02_2738 [Burkholderiaceae bacterium]|jgi:hypothetical protein|nr:hypothetical protein [Burkholderiaceae bacterium]